MGEIERGRQEEAGPLDPGPGKSSQDLEDHGLLRSEEGHTPVHQSQGILRPVSAAALTCERWEQVEAPAPGVGISTPVERRSPRLQPIAVTDEGCSLDRS